MCVCVVWHSRPNLARPFLGTDVTGPENGRARLGRLRRTSVCVCVCATGTRIYTHARTSHTHAHTHTHTCMSTITSVCSLCINYKLLLFMVLYYTSILCIPLIFICQTLLSHINFVHELIEKAVCLPHSSAQFCRTNSNRGGLMSFHCLYGNAIPTACSHSSHQVQYGGVP